MTNPTRRFQRAIVATLAGIAVAWGFDVAATTMGSASRLASFVGRFHPLLVHLPIGMLVLVAVVELVTVASKGRIDAAPVLPAVLPIAFLSTVVAFVVGTQLSRAGGYDEDLLTWHRCFALAAVVGVGAMQLAWLFVERGAPRTIYRAVLAGALGLLSIGAHFGGTMTHGKGYLTAFAPGFDQPRARDAAPVAPGSVDGRTTEPRLFDAVVGPMLRDKCMACHGPDKAKGGLRVDSLEALVKGGKNGPGVVSGDPAKSAVLERIHRPIADEGHMPPAGKPQPSDADVEILRAWIDRGANAETKVSDVWLSPAAVEELARVLGQASVASPKADAAAGASVPDETVVDAGSSSPVQASRAAPAPPSSDAGADADASTSVSVEAASPVRREERRAYADVIAPLLAKKCVRCHGGKKHGGGLRVDSIAALRAGGDGGAGIVPFDTSRGELLRRLHLPIDDEEHMPPSDAPQIGASDVRLLEAWIAHGATADLPASKLSASPARP